MTDTPPSPMTSAPRTGEIVMLYAKLKDFDHRWHEAYFDTGWRKHWRTVHRGNLLYHPTHWAPLGGAPEGFVEEHRLTAMQDALEASRARVAELEDLLRWQVSTIENNIKPGPEGQPHRLILDGVPHTGPAVDWCHKYLTGLAELSRRALAGKSS